MMRDQSIINGRLAVNLAMAARYLGVSDDELLALVSQNVLPVIKVTRNRSAWIIQTEVLQAYQAAVANQSLAQPASTAHPTDGYWPAVRVRPKTRPAVYVIQSDRYFKIGCSFQPFIRVSNLAHSTPHVIRVVGLLPHRNPIVVETELHRKFKHVRMNGEWFKLSDDDMRYLLCVGAHMHKNSLCLAGERAYTWSKVGGGPFPTILAALDYLATL